MKRFYKQKNNFLKIKYLSHTACSRRRKIPKKENFPKTFKKIFVVALPVISQAVKYATGTKDEPTTAEPILKKINLTLFPSGGRQKLQ